MSGIAKGDAFLLRTSTGYAFGAVLDVVPVLDVTTREPLGEMAYVQLQAGHKGWLVGAVVEAGKVLLKGYEVPEAEAH